MAATAILPYTYTLCAAPVHVLIIVVIIVVIVAGGPAAAAAVGVTRGCGKSKSSPPARLAIAVLFRPILLARPIIIALREGHATPTRLYCERLFFKFHVRVFVSPFRKRIAKHRSRVYMHI
uniref:Secreted peptide n=1 Tax=Trichogramma kaykai TaxID=54128 RepID=A0ABD2XRL3_9HYME